MKPGWREMIFIVMLGLVPLGAWAYIKLPREKAKKRMDNEFYELVQIHNNVNQQKENARNNVKKTRDDLIKRLGVSRDDLITPFVYRDAQAKIMQLAKKNHLSLGFEKQNRGRPRALEGTYSFEAYTFKLTDIQGRFQDFFQFLRELGVSGYRVWIPSVVIERDAPRTSNPSEAGQGANLIKAHLQIRLLVPVEGDVPEPVKTGAPNAVTPTSRMPGPPVELNKPA
ncbi:MAG: hypothetical protein HN909_04385 [Phycisphaerales bacterium]|mgnify:CR=1 FL=1|jgi:hypothetical protein|nr:hypothetical protein [Phycisphaerales bacterium]MBT7170990.1 hypothetical protein [Phycisphaerales bacterium]